MVKVINVPEDVVLNIQTLAAQEESRKEIIAFMLSNKYETDTKQFQKFQTEYEEAYFKFSQAKQDFENQYVRTVIENPQSWNLDYATCSATINY